MFSKPEREPDMQTTNTYEAKQEARLERLLAAADKAEARANQAYRRADLREEASSIVLGKAILVGHHTERRHGRTHAGDEAARGRAVAERTSQEEISRPDGRSGEHTKRQ